jgi:thiosulfate/3-mercaptopyruvate sulfurtransferase
MPGAINVPFQEVFIDETGEMHPPQVLRQLFEAKGIQLDQPIITSCGKFKSVSSVNINNNHH